MENPCRFPQITKFRRSSRSFRFSEIKSLVKFVFEFLLTSDKETEMSKILLPGKFLPSLAKKNHIPIIMLDVIIAKSFSFLFYFHEFTNIACLNLRLSSFW